MRAFIRCPRICVRRGRQTPSTTLAVETARSTHNTLRSAPNDPVIVSGSNGPATAPALRVASSWMEPRTWKLPAKTRTPVASFTQAPSRVMKCAVHGNRQHARDKRERRTKEKKIQVAISAIALAHQGVASERSRRRRKAHEDKQARDGSQEPHSSDRMEKFNQPSQGVSKIASSTHQIVSRPSEGR